MVARSAGGNNKSIPYYTGLQVQTSALNVPIAIMWGRNRITFNLIWWNDFRRYKVEAGKGGGGKGGTQYTYSVAALMSLCWGEISSIPVVYTNQATSTLANLALTLYSGTPSQTPFPYIVATHPDQALSYPNIAYLAASLFDLASSPILPSISLEAVGNLSGSMPGTDDANLGDIIPDFLTNPLYGMGLDAGDIGASVAYYKQYQQAEGLFFSPVLTQQEKATDIINRWAALSNTWIFWGGLEMMFVPLGDREVTGNGETYVPVTDIRYEIGAGDFLDADAPVKVSRKDPADAYNTTRIQIKDRALDYNTNPIEYKDQTLIDRYGVRDNNGITADEVTESEVGLKVVTLIGKRAAYLLNDYAFRTSNRFVRLQPGDLVRLTDPTTPAITNLPVRVRTVECGDDGALSFVAEDYPGTVGTPIPQDLEPPDPTAFNMLVPPGDVNPPCIFEPDSSLNDGPPQVWIAASGGEFWGGANVFVSFDGVTYAQIDTINAPAKQGVLTDDLPSHADPDTVNTLAVDLGQSFQQLLAVTNADADAFRSLSYVVEQPTAGVIAVDGELLAYGDVASTGTYTDDLTYLRRGLYGSTLGGHLTGDQFTLIDINGTTGSLVRYPIPAQYIGETIHVKFCSFNLYGLSVQDISSVVDYTYDPTGRGYGGGGDGLPNVPTGLSGSPSGANNVMAWDANPATDNVLTYILYRADGTGAGFGTANVIWQGNATSYLDTNITLGDGYTYFVSAVNAVGESGPTAGVDVTASAPPSDLIPLRVSAGTPNRKPEVGEVLFTVPMKTGDELPADLVGSELQIDVNAGGVAPTADWTIILKKNAATIFTGTIAAAAFTGSFSTGAAVIFSDGDFLSAVCITPQDATCEGISITIIGTRTQ
jgi:hypothetical protein